MSAGVIKVLVVDDSVVMRRALTEALAPEEGIEVVGSAANGEVGLQKVKQLSPDLVTLDIEMPILDGLETLKVLRKDYPQLPVIMVSALTQRGAAVTLDALSMGASDYIAKPTREGTEKDPLEMLRESLVPKIRALAKRSSVEPAARPAPSPAPVRRALRPAATGKRVEIVVIGVSTGGPNALVEVIPSFSADFRVPIVMVQHMPPVFTKSLAERLDRLSPLNVIEAEAGMDVRAGRVYIAPGDYHMTLARDKTRTFLELNQDPKEHSCRPAVDPLLRSAVELYGGAVCAVILTGMGSDGAEGCRLVAEQGGSVVVQDEESSVVWGMPGAVVQDGSAEVIVPLGEIVEEVGRRVQRIGA